MNFLDRYCVLSKKEYGFRSGTFTEDAIYDLTYIIYRSLDDKSLSERLLEELCEWGLARKLNDPFRSYLKRRVQYVQLDDTLSSGRMVDYGILQGTVLGSVLFSINTNGILKLDISGKIISFADDTAILYGGNSW